MKRVKKSHLTATVGCFMVSFALMGTTARADYYHHPVFHGYTDEMPHIYDYGSHKVTSNVSPTSISLSWPKDSSDKITISRADNPQGNNVPGQIIATLGKDATSFTDNSVSPNNTYEYEICFYTTKNGQDKLKYKTAVREYTGLSAPFVVDNILNRGQVSTSASSIKFSFYERGGIKPTGYEVYRKVKGANNKFEKIADIAASSPNNTFIDKAVVHKTTYKYKIRSYYVDQGSVIYSKYSPASKLKAVNSTGKYKIKSVTVSENAFTLKLRSRSGNGTISVTNPQNGALSYYPKFRAVGGSRVQLKVSYSTDNKTWKSFDSQKVNFKPSSVFYLRFESADGTSFISSNEKLKDYGGFTIVSDNIVYAGFPVYLFVDWEDMMVKANVSPESVW